MERREQKSKESTYSVYFIALRYLTKMENNIPLLQNSGTNICERLIIPITHSIDTVNHTAICFTDCITPGYMTQLRPHNIHERCQITIFSQAYIQMHSLASYYTDLKVVNKDI